LIYRGLPAPGRAIRRSRAQCHSDQSLTGVGPLSLTVAGRCFPVPRWDSAPLGRHSSSAVRRRRFGIKRYQSLAPGAMDCGTAWRILASNPGSALRLSLRSRISDLA
jgi:hypothetical protein